MPPFGYSKNRQDGFSLLPVGFEVFREGIRLSQKTAAASLPYPLGLAGEVTVQLAQLYDFPKGPSRYRVTYHHALRMEGISVQKPMVLGKEFIKAETSAKLPGETVEVRSNSVEIAF